MEHDYIKYGLMLLMICTGLALLGFATEVAPAIADRISEGG